MVKKKYGYIQNFIAFKDEICDLLFLGPKSVLTISCILKGSGDIIDKYHK